MALAVTPARPAWLAPVVKEARPVFRTTSALALGAWRFGRPTSAGRANAPTCWWHGSCTKKLGDYEMRKPI